MTQGHQTGQPVVEVENVSKSFLLRREQSRDLKEKFSISRLQLGRTARTEEFWAVKDVSFEVKPGQSVGIVGHNGSGKSTMLKMLTGILKPTHGSVSVRGRIGALIEVGAGFHPDLTGRENVYLNGSIVGLSRREIATKFDEIVSFAGLERFIDTPVKRYSTGMYMRLGFAIAIHTAPDILLIDEVLAVGDAMFQRKCLRKLTEFVENGGAAVFVSHAMPQVALLCATCVWLDHGQARYVGPTNQAIDQYMAVVSEREDTEFKRQHPEEWTALEEMRLVEAEEERLRVLSEERRREAAEREENERLTTQRAGRAEDVRAGCILGVTLRDAQGIAGTSFAAGEPLRIEIQYRFGARFTNPVFGVDFYRDDGLHMFTTSNYDHGVSLSTLPAVGTLSLDIPSLSLNEGAYRLQVNLFADAGQSEWWTKPDDTIADAVAFQVHAGRFAHGCVYLASTWDLSEATNIAVVQEPLPSRESPAPGRVAAMGAGRE